MAYADPQTVTVNAVPITLARSGSALNQGTFQSADTLYSMSVSHTYGRRSRRALRFNISKISADPLVPSQNLRSSASIMLVVDQPVNGYTVAELKQAVDGFVAYLSGSSGARVSQLLGGEN